MGSKSGNRRETTLHHHLAPPLPVDDECDEGPDDQDREDAVAREAGFVVVVVVAIIIAITAVAALRLPGDVPGFFTATEVRAAVRVAVAELLIVFDVRAKHLLSVNADETSR